VNKYSADELFKIAYSHLQKKEFVKSSQLFEKLLKDYPDNLSLLRNISHAYAFSGAFQKAEESIKKVLKIKPDEPFAYQFLASVLKNQDKIKEMIEIVNEGLKKNLINKKWEMQKKLLSPLIARDEKELEDYRVKIEKGLEEIISSDIKLDYDNDQVILPPIFELTYTNKDNLKINKKMVKALKKIYQPLNRKIAINQKLNDKIKIGFVSEFFTDHTIGKLFKNLIFSLDLKFFDIVIYHSSKTKKGRIFEEFKNENKKGFKNEILPSKLIDKIKIIEKEKFDILFYPDIGMSIEFYFLSLIRLAKYQIMSWGHPETTGSESIDYFLCSKHLILKNSEKFYSEKFLIIDKLPMIYNKPVIENKLDEKDISKKNIYSCPQTLFKFHPDFDDYLFNILKKDKKGILYLLKDANKVYYLKLLERFKKNKNFDSNRVIFLDPLNLNQFINHLGTSSVLLDPIYFGSGNSFHESMFYGTQTVTCPTKYIKSRIVSAAYIQMEVDNPPIVKDKDEYVSKAIEIANDENILNKKKYYQQAANKKLFNTKDVGEKFNSILKRLF
tara:strand:- start:1070 stop:2737 length:1668 start_codon:yes stop_codon:yes gene_type:complete